MSLEITTTGTQAVVVVSGKELTHPATNVNLLLDMPIEEIDMIELETKILAGLVTAKWKGFPLTDFNNLSENYDIFTGTSPGGNPGLVPNDGLPPSGRVLKDTGNWETGGSGGSGWEDEMKVESYGPFNGTQFEEVDSKNFNVPSDAWYEWTISYGFTISRNEKSILSRLFIDGSQVDNHRESVANSSDVPGYTKTNEIYLTAGVIPVSFEVATSANNANGNVQKVYFNLRRK